MNGLILSNWRRKQSRCSLFLLDKVISFVLGSSWISFIFGDAIVGGDANIFGNAKVYGEAMVYGEADVCDNAEVCGDMEVYD